MEYDFNHGILYGIYIVIGIITTIIFLKSVIENLIRKETRNLETRIFKLESKNNLKND